VKKTLRAEEIHAIIEAPYRASDPATYFPSREGRIRCEASIREIIRALQTAPTPQVRYTLMYVLSWRGAKSTIPVILPYLNDRSSRVRGAAADALYRLALIHFGKVSDLHIGAALLERFEGKERTTSTYSTLALALGAVQYRPAIPALIRALTSADEGKRRCAAIALSNLQARESTDSLRHAVEHEQIPHTREKLQLSLDRIVRSDEHGKPPYV
jgi:HEAT repeat protein